MNVIAKTLLTITAFAALPFSAFAKDHKKKAAGVVVSWKDLPAAVQTTIQGNAAGGKVVEVEKQTANGVLFYCAEVRGTDHKWTKVYVTDTGALIKSGARQRAQQAQAQTAFRRLIVDGSDTVA